MSEPKQSDLEKATQIIRSVVPGELDTVEAIAQALATERARAIERIKQLPALRMETEIKSLGYHIRPIVSQIERAWGREQMRQEVLRQIEAEIMV